MPALVVATGSVHGCVGIGTHDATSTSEVPTDTTDTTDTRGIDTGTTGKTPDWWGCVVNAYCQTDPTPFLPELPPGTVVHQVTTGISVFLEPQDPWTYAVSIDFDDPAMPDEVHPMFHYTHTAPVEGPAGRDFADSQLTLGAPGSYVAGAVTSWDCSGGIQGTDPISAAATVVWSCYRDEVLQNCGVWGTRAAEYLHGAGGRCFEAGGLGFLYLDGGY
jgi:hypothetical protein